MLFSLKMYIFATSFEIPEMNIAQFIESIFGKSNTIYPGSWLINPLGSHKILIL